MVLVIVRDEEPMDSSITLRWKIDRGLKQWSALWPQSNMTRLPLSAIAAAQKPWPTSKIVNCIVDSAHFDVPKINMDISKSFFTDILRRFLGDFDNVHGTAWGPCGERQAH